MKVIKSRAKNIRGSAIKIRIPARVVKGMKVEEALSVLQYMRKKAAKDVYKVVRTAQADAEHNFNLQKESLIVNSIRVDEGLKYKRFRPSSRGNAKPFVRKFSHITVELSGEEASSGKAKPAKSAKKPEKIEKKSEVKAVAKSSKAVKKKANS